VTRGDVAALGGIAVLTLAIYGRVIGDEFLPEDIFRLHAGSDFLRYLAGRGGAVPQDYFRPGVWTFAGAVHALFGASSAGYYALGLVLHALYASAVYLFLRGVGAVSRFAAGLASLLVVATPPHANVVFWISAHSYLLALLAVVLCLGLLLRERPDRRSAVLAVLIFTLGLSLHASVIGAVPALLAGGLRSGAPPHRSRLRLAAAVALVVLAVGFYGVERARGAVARFDAGPLQAAKNAVTYAALPYYPFGSVGLTAKIEGVPALAAARLIAREAGVEVALAAITITLATWALLRGTALARTGAALFFGGLVLYTPYRAVSSRFATMAVLGLAMMAAAALAAVEAQPRRRLVAGVLGGVLVVVLGGVTAARLTLYRSVSEPFRALRATVVAAPPGSTVIVCNVGERAAEDTHLLAWARFTAGHWVPRGVGLEVDSGACGQRERAPSARFMRFVPPAAIVPDARSPGVRSGG
jgi:hypothetical protein